MIKIVTCETQLSIYESDWNSLYEKTSGATPFQKYGYVVATLYFIKNEGKFPYFIFVRDAQRKEIVAIFPFVVTKRHKLEFINQIHSDFCMPLINPEIDHFNLYKELSDHIKNDKMIRDLNLINVPAGNSLLSSFKFHFKYSIVHDINYYPIVPIGANVSNKSFIDGFITVPSKRRGNLRKSFSQIEDRCQLKIIRKSNGDNYPEEIVFDLTNQMIKDEIRGKDYFSDQMLSWWKRLYEYDVLSLAILFEEQKPVSCTLIFQDDKNNECVTWIMLYVSNVWNMRANLFISKYIYDHGDGALNLARGIYDYKVTNFHPDIKPLFCLKIAKTKWGHFKNVISTAFHFSKPIIKSWLRR